MEYFGWGVHLAKPLLCRDSPHSDDAASFETCSRLMRCGKCDMEFCVDAQVLGEGVAIRSTVWKNLGFGWSSFSECWQRHRREIGGDRLGDSHAVGGIRDVFEGAGDGDGGYGMVGPDASLRVIPQMQIEGDVPSAIAHSIEISLETKEGVVDAAGSE